VHTGNWAAFHEIPAMTHFTANSTVLVGLQYGDEGKGQMVDRLSSSHDVIIRYNGGANAGHSVQVGNVRFALHQIPIGVLTPGRLNVLANGVVLDVERFTAELDALRGQGVGISDNLKISDRAHLVMPHHRREEYLRDRLAEQMLGEAARLGTTARGIGPAYADKAARDTAVRVCDLFEPESLRHRLHFVATIKDITLGALAARVGVPHESVEAAQLADMCADWAREIRPYVCDTGVLLKEAVAAGRRLLFEGANAALLDFDHGTYPFVTASNSSALGITGGTGLPPSVIGDVVGVAKLYVSRVGTGPFPTEIEGKAAETLRQRGDEYGTTTGRPRRIGWLDLPALRSAARLNGVTRLVLTGLAVLSELASIRVCVAYRYRGKLLQHLPASAAVLEDVEPVYHDVEGFGGEIGECGSFEELPEAAQALVQFVEHEVGPVAYVCTGRRREQLLARDADVDAGVDAGVDTH
jgi:adenylosuccinate synthase